MIKRTVKLNNAHGLHCRPATFLIQLSKKFDAEVVIVKNDKRAKTTDILDLLTLCLTKGDINLEATGVEAEQALDAIEKFLNEYETEY